MTGHDRALRKAFRDGYKAAEDAAESERVANRNVNRVETAIQQWEAINRTLFDVPTDLKSRISEIEAALERIRQESQRHSGRRRASQ
jgi:predicted RNase H-like nuclease (RuvC/YqgF family)